MKRTLFALSLMALVASCVKEEVPHHQEATEAQVYGGKAVLTGYMDRNEPTELVLTLDANLMNSLPVGNIPPQMFELAMPGSLKEKTLIDFVGLDWNPSGHEPTGIYTLPHFDIHYYFLNHHQVMAIGDPTKMDNLPAAAYLPANYVPGPGVPQMGKHWLDVNSPELNGGPFTQTFIWGSYDGRVSFYEPMITSAYLLSINQFERSIPQPAKVQKSAYYPTRMRLEQQQKTVRIILKDFQWRQAS